MAQSQFSLSWDDHKRNICIGLSSLQQNGELVDMTLAADGHHVKVHQIMLALASPYIKELIASAQCQHPIIFLNKVSYTTLCSILEYIYTGEVLVSVENLNDLVEAGKELHIKGLEDMKLHDSLNSHQRMKRVLKLEEERLEDEICYFEISQANNSDEKSMIFTPQGIIGNVRTERIADESMEDNTHENSNQDDEGNKEEIILATESVVEDKSESTRKKGSVAGSNASAMQYTVSTQGSLQMILNRFVYYLKHTNRNGSRQWRCVDYLSTNRCPALVVTKEDIVIQRISAHTHTFHDKKILKKVHAGSIFSALHEAEGVTKSKRRKPTTNEGPQESE